MTGINKEKTRAIAGTGALPTLSKVFMLWPKNSS
jgi:hypothetical protein